MNNLRTADEYRAAVASNRQAEIDSWERSDTDGFLSQWASGQMAARYAFLATVAENGGRMKALALFLNGELASTHQCDGQYGFYWVLNDEAAEQFGKRFFSPSKAKNAVARDKARGFTFGYIEAPAFEGHGSKAQIDWDAVKGGDFTIVATDGAYDGLDEI